MKFLILLGIACLWGCGGNEAASRPTSYPASPQSDAVSTNNDSEQPAGSQSLPAAP